MDVKSKKLILLLSFIFLFFLLTILVKFVDVRTIELTNSNIGLYFINKINLDIEYNEIFDKLSDLFMYFSIFLIAIFGCIGVFQLMKYKSLFKVEKKLVILGAFIGAMFAIWIAFDKFLVINNRPVLVDGNIEPSYPSTHIMIVTFTLLSSCFFINKNKNIYWGAILCIALCFIFRLLSGMHWVSDCIGGILAGLILYYGYLYTCEKMSTEKRE